VIKGFFKHWQGNFWAGLAIVLPAVVSIALLVWLFGTVANITDTLLVFLPQQLTHADRGAGPMHWYWSWFAFLLALFLICVVGQLARHYFGKKFIEWVDAWLLRVPLLNKIYGASKQVNEALSTGNKTAFRTAAIIEFPSQGNYVVGFITSEVARGAHSVCDSKLVTVFVPTTPNPTSGFLILVPEEKVQRLEMPVGDGIKFIISLGSIPPNLAPMTSKPIEASEAPSNA
jgi:uncharacterized membrane protein